ncbi:hypothetical protein AMBLS11_14610 [Alteromonas macleodii str. 'Black Sea 11']|jgi:hypothetical protein|nr:hypothetical protein AMBLS11_14610 [Alteromonas macleodii str. 'Black Sea 11']
MSGTIALQFNKNTPQTAIDNIKHRNISIFIQPNNANDNQYHLIEANYPLFNIDNIFVTNINIHA